MTRAERKSKERIAKKLFSQYIRERDGKCQKCGKTTSLQCSHVNSVGAYPALRFDPFNAIALCHRCHIYWWHKEPLEASEWFQNKFPAQYAYLVEARHESEKVDLLGTIEWVKGLLNEQPSGV